MTIWPPARFGCGSAEHRDVKTTRYDRNVKTGARAPVVEEVLISGRPLGGGMPSRAIAPALEVVTPAVSVSLEEKDAVACERARDHLLALQEPDGHWRGLLQTNVSMDAEDLL